MPINPMRAALVTLALVLAAPAAAQDMKPGLHFIENWDFDANGAVSLDEATERRADIFTTFDADENDVLSPDEYDLFDEARQNDMEMNAAAVGGPVGGGMGGFDRSMRREVADLDGDGNVTREEFVGGTPAWFAMRDRDGNGAITIADFGRGGN